ncbi:MAG: rRNA maturation RNase YbeY [Phycisphaerales bacterium]|nr:rRNA maturation RNase YbeY [Phycisphaerales bacterium]
MGASIMGDPPRSTIEITTMPGLAPVDADVLRRCVATTLDAHHADGARISVALVDDPRIAQLNHRFLEHEGATDVISFDLRDGGESGVDGELVISLETAAREAAARGHDVTAEAALYAIHGTLHLLGFDDVDDATSAVMRERERAMLTAMGLTCLDRS